VAESLTLASFSDQQQEAEKMMRTSYGGHDGKHDALC